MKINYGQTMTDRLGLYTMLRYRGYRACIGVTCIILVSVMQYQRFVDVVDVYLERYRSGSENTYRGKAKAIDGPNTTPFTC